MVESTLRRTNYRIASVNSIQSGWSVSGSSPQSEETHASRDLKIQKRIKRSGGGKAGTPRRLWITSRVRRPVIGRVLLSKQSWSRHLQHLQHLEHLQHLQHLHTRPLDTLATRTYICLLNHSTSYSHPKGYRKERKGSGFSWWDGSSSNLGTSKSFCSVLAQRTSSSQKN